MQKILNSLQIKSLDEYTIRHEPIASIELMERACDAFVSWFIQRFDNLNVVGVVCGTGNNGGDGLGIARMLQERNYPVTVWIVRGGVPESADFKTNLSELKGKLSIFEITTETDQGLFSGCNILIDGIFGSGLSRPIEGIYAQAIRCMNKAKATRVAIDVPSGLMVDKPSTGEIVQAHFTVTFQLPKLAFLLPQQWKYVGEWFAVNIGLSKERLKQMQSNRFLLERRDIRKIVKSRSKFSHKGNYGHALLIAGSRGKMGAAVLGARAALRSGVGLLTVHVPGCGYPIIQTTTPEAMASIDESDSFFSKIPPLETFDALGVGPGIGQAMQTIKALGSLLESFRKPLVLDADAINSIGTHRELISLIPPESILTPHLKEFERLVGTSTNDFDRLEKQVEFSARTKTIIVLKGAHTAISRPDGKVVFNNTGNPGMAKGGTGDVLTGMLTALLARGYTPEQAASIGVWIHGLAGDKASRGKGEESMIASDLVEALPEVFGSFQ